MIRIFRIAVLAFVVSAVPVAAAGVAQADAAAADCVDHRLSEDYEATHAVLRACRIASTAEPQDVRRCLLIMTDEGIDAATAHESCRIAFS